MLFILSDGVTNYGHSLNDVRNMLKAFKIPIYNGRSIGNFIYEIRRFIFKWLNRRGVLNHISTCQKED